MLLWWSRKYRMARVMMALTDPLKNPGNAMAAFEGILITPVSSLDSIHVIIFWLSAFVRTFCARRVDLAGAEYTHWNCLQCSVFIGRVIIGNDSGCLTYAMSHNNGDGCDDWGCGKVCHCCLMNVTMHPIYVTFDPFRLQNAISCPRKPPECHEVLLFTKCISILRPTYHFVLLYASLC